MLLYNTYILYAIDCLYRSLEVRSTLLKFKVPPSFRYKLVYLEPDAAKCLHHLIITAQESFSYTSIRNAKHSATLNSAICTSPKPSSSATLNSAICTSAKLRSSATLNSVIYTSAKPSSSATLNSMICTSQVPLLHSLA